MPQMSPMWWTLLFIMFTLCLIITLTMMYFYMNSKNPMNNNQNTITNHMNWKW